MKAKTLSISPLHNVPKILKKKLILLRIKNNLNQKMKIERFPIDIVNKKENNQKGITLSQIAFISSLKPDLQRSSTLMLNSNESFLKTKYHPHKGIKIRKNNNYHSLNANSKIFERNRLRYQRENSKIYLTDANKNQEINNKMSLIVNKSKIYLKNRYLSKNSISRNNKLFNSQNSVSLQTNELGSFMDYSYYNTNEFMNQILCSSKKLHANAKRHTLKKSDIRLQTSIFENTVILNNLKKEFSRIKLPKILKNPLLRINPNKHAYFRK